MNRRELDRAFERVIDEVRFLASREAVEILKRALASVEAAAKTYDVDLYSG